MTTVARGRAGTPAGRHPGPIRAKPVLLADGTLLAGSSTEHDGWRVHMESTSDVAGPWDQYAAAERSASLSAIQPTILVHDARRIQILCRTEQGVIAESWSEDGGRTWVRCGRRICRTRAPGSMPFGSPMAAFCSSTTPRVTTAASCRLPCRQMAGVATRLMLEDATGRVLVPRGDPDARRPRARHVHVAPRAHQARRARGQS